MKYTTRFLRQLDLASGIAQTEQNILLGLDELSASVDELACHNTGTGSHSKRATVFHQIALWSIRAGYFAEGKSLCAAACDAVALAFFDTLDLKLLHKYLMITIDLAVVTGNQGSLQQSLLMLLSVYSFLCGQSSFSPSGRGQLRLYGGFSLLVSTPERNYIASRCVAVAAEAYLRNDSHLPSDFFRRYSDKDIADLPLEEKITIGEANVIALVSRGAFREATLAWSECWKLVLETQFPNPIHLIVLADLYASAGHDDVTFSTLRRAESYNEQLGERMQPARRMRLHLCLSLRYLESGYLLLAFDHLHAASELATILKDGQALFRVATMDYLLRCAIGDSKSNISQAHRNLVQNLTAGIDCQERAAACLALIEMESGNTDGELGHYIVHPLVNFISEQLPERERGYFGDYLNLLGFISKENHSNSGDTLNADAILRIHALAQRACLLCV